MVDEIKPHGMRSDAVPVRYETEKSSYFGQPSSKIFFSDGTIITRQPLRNPVPLVLAKDSGQVSAFRPAQYVKPGAFPMMRSVQNMWNRFTNRGPTTEQGAASAASPLTYYLTLWEQRFGRRAMIEDCRTLWLSDPRIFKSVKMFANEACRGGMKIEVFGDDRRSKRAKIIAKRVMGMYKAPYLRGLALGLVLEGDLFMQYVLDQDERLVKVKRMPSIGMERLTDDADEIIDPNHSFEQIDSTTFERVAQFPEALMCHTRLNHIDGDRYGVSEIIAIRRSIRLLGLLEQSQSIRRMTRAAIIRHHKLGDKEKGAGVSDAKIKEYKNKNGYVEGNQEPFDPMNPAKDYFTNAHVEIETLQEDQSIEKIDDLLHFQNVTQAGMPTPSVFYGVDVDRVNRDVVTDMREMYLKGTTVLNESVEENITHAFELALLTEGILPEYVEFKVTWSVSSLEEPTQRVSWNLDMVEGRLITRRTALVNLNDLVNVHDVDKEIEEANKEWEEKTEFETENSPQAMSLHAMPSPTDKKRKAIASNSNSNGSMKKTPLPGNNSNGKRN